MLHPNCHMLQIYEMEESGEGIESTTFPPEYGEYREGVARLDDTLAHQF